MNKPAGHRAGCDRRAERVRRTLKKSGSLLLSDPEIMLYHHEPIVCNGEIKGFLTSGSCGHTLGASVGLGYVKARKV